MGMSPLNEEEGCTDARTCAAAVEEGCGRSTMLSLLPTILSACRETRPAQTSRDLGDVARQTSVQRRDRTVGRGLEKTKGGANNKTTKVSSGQVGRLMGFYRDSCICPMKRLH